MSVKITGLPLTSGINATDLFEKVNDPGGTPVSQRCTAAQIATALGIGVLGVKVYRALLTQSGTDAPVATVWENGLGVVPVYSYSSQGSYVISVSGDFPIGKTFFYCASGINSNDNSQPVGLSFNGGSINMRISDADGSYDDFLNNTPIEILVYP